MPDAKPSTPRLRRRPAITSQHRAARNGDLATYFTELDFDRPGKQVGFVYFPHSPHEDAWGTVRVPVAVIGDGDGPTVLLEGGNHGDEYEGPIVLGELIRELQPQAVRGRLIIIPAINAPAVNAGRRTSPVDGKNMNRVFPGDHAGTLTEQVAAFVNDALIPRADALLSLHSGGSSLDIVPSTIVMPSPDPAQFEQCLAAARAFDAPLCVVMDTLGDRRLCVTAAMAAGLVCVSTEMAGRGVVSPAALRLCRAGTLRTLRLWGLLADEREAAEPPPLKYHSLDGARAYVIASDAGVFEPAVELGQPLALGEVAGRIHFLSDPGRPPQILHAGATGVVYALRQFGRVEPGNTCMVVAGAAPGQPG
ncbi:succinylglutamate desuccinylase/aspartoacylase family protein [Bordetella trematum]|uniref:succinylglutamate desuccinylase/aspartoacylase family protein n=1 Tax=Bordetella trematum TaxID=123899 RepID=UPI000F6418CB|nr:succinylglutamate desuccinylase/aspartoacylase family protein [Bordetella trematum]VDH07049.1 ectoine utilization protein EutE [Bordetella trematum]